MALSWDQHVIMPAIAFENLIVELGFMRMIARDCECVLIRFRYVSKGRYTDNSRLKVVE